MTSSESEVKTLRVGEEVFVLENLGNCWEVKQDRIFKIETQPDGGVKRIFCYSNAYCAVREKHIFRDKKHAQIAAEQLTAAITKVE